MSTQSHHTECGHGAQHAGQEPVGELVPRASRQLTGWCGAN
ncbi:hypothetical protein AB0G87_00230 [Streptomyces asoensis]